MNHWSGSVRRVRRRTLVRWMTAAAAVLALAASLVSVVRRGEDGRRLMAELRGLEAEDRVVTDRIDAARTRVDSLAAPARIERAAEALGLQQASEEQLLQVDAGYSPDEEERGVAGRGGER
ncbi:MAG: hypothetical protein OXI39_00790 [Gemmatimonadota bacterium]|uniref:hypothetical protein n=1 Tax=Candidatus Palauibacter scopulicola TaxID=3056741 RepID=UPI0023898F07|nr:hypothetical protein [Candidatus Palauibacter scopulicola]MDE2661529.1 hypothetical protein [Candidatus Palauibacter scopulicola]